MMQVVSNYGYSFNPQIRVALRRNATIDNSTQPSYLFPYTQEDPGHLPPPVLAFHDVSFRYPGCEPLYSNVNLGVDLDSRIALVGPNGAGKTTLVKVRVGCACEHR